MSYVSRVALGLLLLGLLGLPGTAGAAAAPTTTMPRPAVLTTAQFESQLLSLTNARRKKIGCPAYKTNTALVAAARAHTKRMVATKSFSHQVPKEASLGPRITAAGYKHWKALAENIAFGQSATPSSVFSMWMNSSGHRANIQNCGLRELGYGVKFSGQNVWVTGDYGRR